MAVNRLPSVTVSGIPSRGQVPVAGTGTVAWGSASASPQTINAQTGTSYTVVLTDAGVLVTASNASAIAFTIPPNSSVAFTVGTVIDVAQLGAGQVTLTPGAGVTINGTPGLKLRAQYSVASVVKIATDTWLAVGDIST